MMSASARSPRTARRRSTRGAPRRRSPGGGGRGDEKKLEGSGFNKSKYSPDVAWYLRALRHRAAECALAGDRDGALAASDAVIATLTDVLGEGHPERGVAMLEAAEVAAAAAAAADGGD